MDNEQLVNQVEGMETQQAEAEQPSNEKVDGFYSGWNNSEDTPQGAVETEEEPAARQETTAPEQELPNNVVPLPQQQQPLAVLKIRGREVPVYNPNDLVQLAQQGADYTLKTQALARHREALELLEQYPDLKTELYARRYGKNQEPVQPKEAKPQVKEELPKQGDDETYEEYTARIAATQAEKVAQAKLAEVSRIQRDQQILSSIQRDPLYDAAREEILAARQRGEIPHAVWERANEDPEAFMWIYKAARTTAENKIKAHIASQQQAQAMQAARMQAQQPQQPPAPRGKPPVVEGAASRRPRAKQEADAAVIRDMSREDFFKLKERVLRGL